MDSFELTKKIAKGAALAIVGMGTSKIVAGVIKNNTDPEKVTDKVAIASAATVLGYMAADASRKYTDAKIDEIADQIKKIPSWWEQNVTSRFTS